MKILDRKALHEVYDVEADWKLLIGHRFKGPLSRAAKGNGRSVAKPHRRAKLGSRKRVSGPQG